MTKPKVSVIMSVFNDATFLEQSIKSVLKQSYKNFEFIIVDDASTDESSKLIKDYKKKDNRIIFYQLKSNQGSPIALNKGIQLASGEYIARIDSDDVWLDSDKLLKQLEVMQSNPKLAFIGSWAKVLDINNNDLFNLIYPTDYHTINNKMLTHNCFISSSILLRKKMLGRSIRYGTPGKYAEDYGLWLKLGTKGSFLNIPQLMVAYRINPNGISQTKHKSQINATIRMIKEHKNDYPSYYYSLLIWNIRKFYPKWFKNLISKNRSN
jgi:glycosyltransferase involved in cell wall biosynthesis